MKWKRYWPFERGMHRSPVNSPHKGQWCGDLVMFFFFYMCLHKRLSKKSWGWWFDTPSSSLWRHCKEICLCNDAACVANAVSEYEQSVWVNCVRHSGWCFCFVFFCFDIFIQGNHPAINLFYHAVLYCCTHKLYSDNLKQLHSNMITLQNATIIGLKLQLTIAWINR